MSEQVYEQLMLFQEDSPVSPLVLPGSDEARKMTVISGRKCLESYKSSDPLGSLVRTLLVSSIWRSTRCWLTWKIKATPARRLLFRLVPSTPRTGATDARLWATPNTMDYLPQRSPEALARQASTSRKGRSRPANLREQVDPETVRLWPTPTTQEVEHLNAKITASGRRESKDGKTTHSVCLADRVRLWPTPTARAGKALSDSKSRQGSADLQTVAAMYPTPTTGAGMCGGTGNYQQLKALDAAGQITEEERRSMAAGNGGQLNPDWVEWLMGLPIGWTSL